MGNLCRWLHNASLHEVKRRLIIHQLLSSTTRPKVLDLCSRASGGSRRPPKKSPENPAPAKPIVRRRPNCCRWRFLQCVCCVLNLLAHGALDDTWLGSKIRTGSTKTRYRFMCYFFKVTRVRTSKLKIKIYKINSPSCCWSRENESRTLCLPRLHSRTSQRRILSLNSNEIH